MRIAKGHNPNRSVLCNFDGHLATRIFNSANRSLCVGLLETDGTSAHGFEALQNCSVFNTRHAEPDVSERLANSQNSDLPKRLKEIVL